MAEHQDSRASEQVWAAFPHDPRRDAHAHLRATDADRDRVQEVVAAAYADGRLDRAEFDERLHAVATARTLGELPDLLTDLLAGPASTSAGQLAVRASSGSSPVPVQEAALEAYRDERSRAVWSFITVSAITWLVWSQTSGTGSFPWPAVVSVVLGLRALRTATRKNAIVADHTRRLERKALEAPEEDR